MQYLENMYKLWQWTGQRWLLGVLTAIVVGAIAVAAVMRMDPNKKAFGKMVWGAIIAVLLISLWAAFGAAVNHAKPSLFDIESVRAGLATYDWHVGIGAICIGLLVLFVTWLVTTGVGFLVAIIPGMDERAFTR